MFYLILIPVTFLFFLLYLGIILEIPNSLDGLRNSIAHLCEKMCCADFIDKSQYFLFNVLIYLLRKTLEKKSLVSSYFLYHFHKKTYK